MTTVTVTEVTDPFCTWCWGAEPMLRRLEEIYRDQFEFDYVMGGLVEDFDAFYDAANDIREPRDVAPHWKAASERHGMPVDAEIWIKNPPRSSYPASVACKAAEFQGTAVAHRYLRRLREAMATERKDISRRSVLVELAAEVGLDTEALVDDLEGTRAERAFEADRRSVRRHGATAFPSFRITANGDETWVKGFQPFSALQDAIEHVAPDLEEYDPRPILEFVQRRGRVTTQEVAEVYGMTPGRTIQALRSLEEEGTLSAQWAGNGIFWRPASDEQETAGERDVTVEARETGPSCSLDGDCTTDRT